MFANISDAPINKRVRTFPANFLLNFHRRGQKSTRISDRHRCNHVIFTGSLEIRQAEIVRNVHHLKDLRVLEYDFCGVNVSNKLAKIFMADVRQPNECWRASR